MKESKQECAKPPPPPKPNFKNKDFIKWSKAESCKKEDNIISTDWHETLKKTVPFQPVYDNKPLNMVYLLSGEYGRIWQKERDEWYSNVFVPKAKEKDFHERRQKIRRQAREAKKQAEISIKERKERRAKELEAKAKARAEEFEKLKARVHKLAAPKSPTKTPKKIKPEAKPKSQPEPLQQNQEFCPKGWKPVELTMQCECSDHDKDKNNLEKEKKKEYEPETSRTQPTDQGCNLCPEYVQQLQDIQNNKNELKMETSAKDEKQMTA